MFTGIIETTGIILATEIFNSEMRLRVRPQKQMLDLKHGESIAVNGVCLTVEKFTAEWFEVYASSETLRLTNLKFISKNSIVNLERALMVGQRLGGHFVSGHVDTLATMSNIKSIGVSKLLRFTFAHQFSDFFVPKGSVALDGVSLTVNNCGEGFLEVNIIPATQQATTISQWRVGHKANMEADLISKYLKGNTTKLGVDFLNQCGFGG